MLSPVVPDIVYKNRDSEKNLESKCQTWLVGRWTVLPDLPGPTAGSAIDYSALSDGWWAWEGDIFAYCPDNPEMGGGTYIRSHSVLVKDGKFQDAKSPWYHYIEGELIPAMSSGSVLTPVPHNSKHVIAIVDHLGKEWIKKNLMS